MSGKKRTPIRSGGTSFGSQSFGGSPAMSGFGFSSTTTSVLSFIGEPPDLSQISDSSVVVLFKGLPKKEEVTKVKALEGLLTAVEGVSDVEEAVLSAWVRAYPILSIDVSARVRRLANTLQGAIGAKSGKRLARHMPKIVGPWLCGLFDSDRASAGATQESLLKVFKSEEKLKNLWKVFQSAVLDFCKTTIALETVYTLSDERWVLPDDAEAKFARVMATCCLGVAYMIENLSDEELQQLDESYQEFWAEQTLWTFAFHADPFLRRSAYRLLLVGLEKRPEWTTSNLEMISTALIMKAPAKSQVGSVSVYFEVLEALTRRLPDAWKLAKPSKKKGPLAQFVAFVERGSHTAPPTFWSQLASIFAVVPKETLAENEDAAKGVLTGILNGIKVGPEPRSHLPAAWGCYWDVCYQFLEFKLPWSGFDESVLQDFMLPVYQGYLLDNQPKERFIIPQDDSVVAAVCGNGLMKLHRAGQDTTFKFLGQVWGKVQDSIIDTLKSERSGTEGSAVGRCGERWVRLMVGVLKQLPRDGVVYDAVIKSNVGILAELIETLLVTNGKATGSAVFAEQLLAKLGAEALASDRAREVAGDFFLEKLRGLLEPITIEPLLSAFVSYGAHSEAASFSEPWKKMIHALMMSELPKDKKEDAITLLIDSASGSLSDKVSPVPELDSYIVNKMRSSLPEKEPTNAWKLVKNALKARNNVFSQDATSKILVEMMENLSIEATPDTTAFPKMLDAISDTNPEKLLPFVESPHGKELISKLLALANSPDTNTAHAAGRLRHAIDDTVAGSSSVSVEKLAEVTADNICASVRQPTSEHLSTDYLAMKACALIKEAEVARNKSLGVLYEKLLFSNDEWEATIRPFLLEVKNPSLAISNSLAGGIFFVENEPVEGASTTWNSEGYSKILRMSLFVTKFIDAVRNTSDTWVIEIEKVSNLLRWLLVVHEVVKDNRSIEGANDIWKDYSPEVDTELTEFAASLQRLIQLAVNTTTDQREFASKVIYPLVERCGNSLSPEAFYSARALSVAYALLCEATPEFAQCYVEEIEKNDMWKSPDIFHSTALLVGAENVLPPAKRERVWVGVIGALLGVSSAGAATSGLQLLVLLNTAFPDADAGPTPIPQPRAMNLIRHLLSWVDEDNEEIDLSPGLISEIAKALCHVIPVVGGMYGEHWQSAFDFVRSCWEICAPLEEVHLSMVSASLRLFQVLKSLIGQNDDLDDAWMEFRGDLYSRLIGLLQNAGRPDNTHQPRSIVNTQIARQLRDIDVSLVEDVGSLYPLLRTQSRPIQKAAFDILHLYIPTQQEQLSVDIALSAEAASNLRLPPELLSLVIEAPELPDDEDLEYTNEIPIAIRGYLLSWILIFDHFQNASFKVRSLYVESLKEGQYLPPLLDFISSTLFSRPFDASRVDITSYVLSDTSENPLQDLRALQTHLYYLCLLRTPSLVKSWWLDTSTNRATVLAVEAFTEKYMSPLLIDNELAAVGEWVSSRSEADEDGMKVKVSRAAKEVTASYPVDDQAMDIRIRLPAVFPLRQVEVLGLRRVGLDERRFKQMQLASQAVVNFQSGSIIDALTLFRKNVSLHFQGISECAICYSILAVTPDRSLPNRACSTCKNKFHSSCLLKWFKTSNSSSCPLCRTSFSFYS
ncbi:hypothetical protein FN846DRAFT_926712 [Sphaerosporella brunnea]|uniref:E3 ubiquitin-protein ligase listerin n=1 Tax=Sphaerosporella brunnea TaxID=1250544 RepID=A0A5J5FAE0_9PEZI|nr:hypothetical protein FN846DRAFT_926712 [Sphaerosporella brunnea]